MSERKLYQKFKNKMREVEPNAWVYKIPDTFKLGGKKPGDHFCVVYGIAFLIEFKSEKGVLSAYQAYQMTEFINAGGEALVYWENENNMNDFVELIIEKAKAKISSLIQKGGTNVIRKGFKNGE